MSSIGIVHDVTFTVAMCLVTKCCTHSTSMPLYLPWQHVVTSGYVQNKYYTATLQRTVYILLHDFCTLCTKMANIIIILLWLHEGAIFGKKAVGRPQLQYLKQVTRNTGADSYTAMKRMTCNNSKWKDANQPKDWRIRRRRSHIIW